MSARYVLPVFNNLVNIWRNGRLYTDPPDVITVGNLALGRRVSGSKLQSNTTNPSDGGMWLLVPIATDVRDSKALSGEDMVEVPGGTGRLYTVKWVDDIGKGFANEHRFAVIFGLPPWGVPFPGPPMPPPPPPSTLPYGKVVSLIYSPDAVTFTPSGKVVVVFVWVTGLSGPIPTVNSSTAGSLLPLNFQGGIVNVAGYLGSIWSYQYLPLGPSETLSVSVGGVSQAYAWTVEESDHLTNDDEFQAYQPTVTVGGLTLSVAGPTDNGYMGFLQDGNLLTNTFSGDFTPSGVLPATALTDGGGSQWTIGYFNVLSAPTPSVNITDTITPSPGNCIFVGQTLSP